MGTIGIVLSMFAAVILSSVLVRMIPLAVPTPLIQIALGAGIAMLSDHAVQLDPEIFFLLFLPPLLFLDGWRIPKQGVLHDKGMIIELAIGLVICTVVGMGFFIHWMIPAIPLPVAFALAAIVSPTDPVAVSAITARVPIPRRIMHILEGESLLNDASGLVCFRFAVAAALTGTFSLPHATLTFVQLTVVGTVIGTALSFCAMWLMNSISRRFGEESGSKVLVSLLIPFAAYQSAEHMGGSGILAAVAAGVTMSYAELSGRALASTRVQRTAVWDTVQFTLNGIMFVLLGEQLPKILASSVDVVRESNHDNPWWLAVYVLAINLGLASMRFIWVWLSFRFTAALAAARGEPPIPKPTIRLVAAMSVAGVRGTITLAGVLTLPLLLATGTPFPAHDLTVFLAAGVIILSLSAASIALPRLLNGLALMGEPGPEAEMERARVVAAEVAIRAIEATLHDLASGQNDADMYADAASRVMEIYRRRLEGYTTSENAVRVRASDEIERKLRLAALHAERDTFFAMARAHSIGDATSRKLVREIDLQEERLR
jgi:Na+/H+ antiporter